MNVTGEQIKDAMIAASIEWVSVHKCSLCGYQCGYARVANHLFYDAGCGCLYRPPELREWDSVADFINRQSDPDTRQRLAASFGAKF